MNYVEEEIPTPPIKEDLFKFNSKCECEEPDENTYHCLCDEIEEEEEEWEYSNYETEKEPRFGETSYMVSGGGMMNGNAYATIELKDGLYYYCEYGNYPTRKCVGNKIVWSDEIYDKKDPYCMRQFSIWDI